MTIVMNELRLIKIRHINNSIRPIKTSDNGHSNSSNSTNNKKPKNKENLKLKLKKDDRNKFKLSFSHYITYNASNIAGTNYVKYTDVNNKEYKIIKNEKKGLVNPKDSFDVLKNHTAYFTLVSLDKNFFKLSKAIKKAYKKSDYKIKKVDADIEVFNLSKSYIENLSKKSNYNDSLFNIYEAYNYTISDINYDYLNDFHINIKKDIEKIRKGYKITADFKTPKYLSNKRGAGRKKIYELAFKLVTTSNEVSCYVPPKKYFKFCETKEDFILTYKMLGKGMTKYMRRYQLSPLFEIFLKAVKTSDILNKLGYNKHKLTCNELYGISAILFTTMVLNSYGTLQGIKAMLTAPSKTYNNTLIDIFKIAFN